MIRGLRAETVALAAAARTLNESNESLAKQLLETTEAAYRGGELSVLDLIDVYDRSLVAALYALDLALAARVSRVCLDYL